MFSLKSLLALSASLFASTVISQNCLTTTVQGTVPAPNSTNVALQSFSYCGGDLDVTVFIANLDYNKFVTLYYTNRQNESTPLASVSLGYNSSVADSNFELWGANVPVYLDGISELLNLTYQATDIGQTFYQQLGFPVNASGAAAPIFDPSPPAPYASPSGYADDITEWLAAVGTSEAAIAKSLMFFNINPNVTDAVGGTVVAAQSGPSFDAKDPDYEYDWVRDSSLTMDVVQSFYAASNTSALTSLYEDILLQYADGRATEQNDPGLQTGLGEPKFYLNNTIFTGPWGRPQNDGPATAAITLMEFANVYLAHGGNITTVKQSIYDSSSNPQAPVLKDLLFVANNWSYPSFDLWEEESSDHFYTRMVQRRALIMGAQFATSLGDNLTTGILSGAAADLSATLDQFWDPNRALLLYEYGPVLKEKSSYKDIAVVLGVIHGYAGDGVYSYTNDQVLSSALQISTSFLPIYGIANTTTDANGLPLGIPIGRYPEDVYNGTGTETDGGNPWFLCTASMAELFYRAASEYCSTGSLTVTNTSADFFSYYAPNANLITGQTYESSTAEFSAVIAALQGWGDAYIRRIKYHAPAGGHLPEEYNRDTGVAQGAADLTWSYAALLTAAFARAQDRGESGYIASLAAMGDNVHLGA